MNNSYKIVLFDNGAKDVVVFDFDRSEDRIAVEYYVYFVTDRDCRWAMLINSKGGVIDKCGDI